MMAKKQGSSDDYERLLGELRSRPPRSLYVVCGDEPYRLEEICRAVERRVLPSAAAAAYCEEKYHLDGQFRRLDFPALDESLRMPPLFGGRRLIFIKDSGLFSSSVPSDIKETARTFLARALEAGEAACVFFAESQFDLRNTLSKFVREKGALFSVGRPGEEELLRWIRLRFREEGIATDPDLPLYLLEACEGEMSLLDRELQKLCLYARGKKEGVLPFDDARRLARPNLSADVFALLDATAAGRLPSVVSLYEKLIRRQEAPAKLLLMIGRQFRELLCVKEAKGLSESALLECLGYGANMRWKIGKLERQARGFGADQLADLIRAAADCEWALKNNGSDEDSELLMLLSRAAGAVRAAR